MSKVDYKNKVLLFKVIKLLHICQNNLLILTYHQIYTILSSLISTPLKDQSHGSCFNAFRGVVLVKKITTN